ncbi:MAG: hypothetical protein P4L71_00175 [Acetobacteraceae bacterium]|nr:hypothetical protein [Acetobacteraceae bacterium]
MPGNVDVVIPVEAEAASALTDARKREAVGRIVSRILRAQAGDDPLVGAMEQLAADAQARDLTPEFTEFESIDELADGKDLDKTMDDAKNAGSAA